MAIYWPHMYSVVENLHRICDTCTARKPTLQYQRAPLKQYIVGCPLKRVDIDILGPLPKTKRGNNTKHLCDCCQGLLHKMDRSIHHPRSGGRYSSTSASRGVHLYVWSSPTAPIWIKAPISRASSSNKLASYWRLTKHVHLAEGHRVKKKPNTWDKHLPSVMLVHRSSIHGSTGLSPNMTMLGCEVELPHHQGDLLRPWAQKLAVFLGQCWHLEPHSPVLINISADNSPLNLLTVKNSFFSLIIKTLCH